MEAAKLPPYFIAFFGGLASFFSPCILPLVPSYLSFITGISMGELKEAKAVSKVRRLTVLHSLMFILAFTVVFTILGVFAQALQGFRMQYETLILRVGGVIIILLGIHITGLINLKFLQREKRFELGEKPGRLLGSAVVGLVFAFGWTPCVGPVLGAIWIFSLSNPSASALITMLFFSLGLALPFFISSLAVNSFLSHFEAMKRHMRVVSIVSGAILVLVGIALFTGLFEVFGEWAVRTSSPAL